MIEETDVKNESTKIEIEEELIEKTLETDKVGLSKASMFLSGRNMSVNPWGPDDIDKLETPNLKQFRDVVKACRFFYRKDSIASTVINKMVDIGITDLIIDKENLTPNEYKLLLGLKEPLEEFAESMALEFLISGLVVPEINYARVNKRDLKEFKIKKFDTLIMPISMWLRDPATVIINSPLILSEPSYYIEIPQDLIIFITSKGIHPDGTKDKELYKELIRLYPEFVIQVRENETRILLENPLIFRRRVLTDSPYPNPFLNPAIESLKHKRNLKRMDYSLAARVISAIQLFKLGDKDFPVTEEQGAAQFDAIRDQMYWRNTGNKDIERIFQLFANHTLEIEWIMPPLEALLDEAKYKIVNQDILFALGFPRILVTGETEKTGTSNSEFAMMSPSRTLETIRKKILKVLNIIVRSTFEQNRLKGEPYVRFRPMNLIGFKDFIDSLVHLYNTGNLSRTAFTEYFGYNFRDEVEQRAKEAKILEKLGVEEFNPQPFSPKPNNDLSKRTDNNNNDQKNKSNDDDNNKKDE